jgi:hypothetical protein
LHQSVLNSKKDTFYYVFFVSGSTSQPSPAKYSISGAKDTAFPLYTLSNAMGIAMDSMDRTLIESYSHSLVALSPANGNNLLSTSAGSDAGQYEPAALPQIDFGNQQYIELQRYSDRHYFWFGCAASASPPTSYGGVIDTGIPAPNPQSVLVVDAGNGGKVTITWSLPPDPEATGVKIYRGTTSGPLSSKTLVASNATGGTFTDQGLTNGQTYYYTIRTAATDPFTGTSYESANLDELTAAPSANRIPPDPPANQLAVDLKDGGRVILTWTDPSANLDHINIYQSTAAGTLGPKITTVAKGVQQYIVSGLTNGTPYFFTVKGSNGPGDESSNTAQLSATPTDSTPPTFAGLASIHDYGYPGFRLTWSPAVDNSNPVTYNVYAGSSPATVNYSHSLGTTSVNSFDLRGLPVGQDVFIAVRATDSLGNTDTNTKVVAATPVRVITDSDVNAPANSDKVNFRPDPAYPALIPSDLGGLKGTASDLFEGGFAAGIYSYQTNDKKGKVSYTLPITAAGRYDIAAFWTPTASVNTPGYVYHITLPDGTTVPNVVLDQIGVNSDATGPTGGIWNYLTTLNLTPGNLVVVGDATASTSTDPAALNVSGAIRALLTVIPSVVPIYQATGTTTIDGNISDAEWKAYPAISLGHAYQDVIGGKWSGIADYSSAVKVKWDADNLYVAAKVTDDVLAFPVPSTASPLAIWNNDALELYLGLSQPWVTHGSPYVAGDYQLVLGGTTDNAAAGAIAGAYYSAQADFSGSLVPTVAVVKTAAGYNLEASIPWSIFSAYPSAPDAGSIIGFNIHGDDNDNTTTPEQDSAFSLSGLSGSATDPSAWITAKIIAGNPPAPVKGDVDGDGVFTAADVRLAFLIAAGLAPATDQALKTGDVVPVGAPDGKIDMRDVVRLERALNGKDTL